MSDFDRAVAITLAHEGGFFQNKTTGEVVNMGITQRFLRRAGLPSTVEDVKALTRPRVIELYLEYFWTPLRLAEINDKTISDKVFDLAVNMGAPTAVQLFQKAINDVWRGNWLVVDGQMGAATIGSANAADPVLLLAALRARAAEHYRSIATANSKESGDLAVWLARLAS